MGREISIAGLAWRLQSNARSIHRLTARSDFMDFYNSTSESTKSKVVYFINTANFDALDLLFKSECGYQSLEDLRALAYTLGVPRFSRMNVQQLKEEVMKYGKQRARLAETFDDDRQKSWNPYAIRVQDDSSSVQQEETTGGEQP